MLAFSCRLFLSSIGRGAFSLSATEALAFTNVIKPAPANPVLKDKCISFFVLIRLDSVFDFT